MNDPIEKFWGNGVWTLSAFLALISAAILTLVAQASGTNRQVVIDGNLPLTGPVAAFCGDYPKAFTMGIDEGCKQLSVSKSTFKIDCQDNKGQPSQAVSVFRKQMMTEIPDLYISGVSQESLAIAPELGQKNIPHLMVSFGALICHNGPNRFRILPHYKIEGPAYVEYARQRHAKRVFVISIINPENDDKFARIVEPGLSKLGIEHQRESYNFETRDFRTLALKASSYKPDLIMIEGFSVHLQPILGALRDYGLIKNGNVLVTLDFADLIHNKTPRSELVGIPFVTPAYEITSQDAKRNGWSRHFEQIYKKDPTYVEAYAYDAGQIIVAAYKKCGKVDMQSIRNVLPFHGICGLINIDQDGDLNTKLEIAQVMSDGTVQAIAVPSNHGQSR